MSRSSNSRRPDPYRFRGARRRPPNSRYNDDDVEAFEDAEQREAESKSKERGE